MVTKREKLERKLEKREEWAEKAREKCSEEFETARKITENIPFGQPILVGHHSEKKHRRDIERSASHMDKGCAEYRKAEYHEEKARGLSRMLENTIFSDDEDAIERLTEKLGDRRALQEGYKRINKIIRSKQLTSAEKVKEILLVGIVGEENATEMVGRGYGIPAYAMQNNNGEIRRLEQRIKEITRRKARQAEAEQAGGVAVTFSGDYATVTFAEKPEYSIIRSLKDTGFYFSRGSWRGLAACLPECVRALLPPAPVAAVSEAQA